LNAVRFHPLDTLLTYSIEIVPLVLLGCPEPVIALFVVFTAVHGMFQHANVRLRLGPLNWIFSMAELHRWHHSKTVHEGNSNYGTNLILWDVVFGTRYLPRDRDPPEEIGIAGMPRFPSGYLDQVASPLRWRRLVAANRSERTTGELTADAAE
jgi:sterol desaturase/sphingolipid hydroxylase (fatty acid hydroxylase superfamily)